MLLEFRFDLRGVANKKKFVDVRVLTQRHNGAGNEVRRAKITAHRVEGDLHRCETLRAKTIDCKAKFVAASPRRAWLESTSPGSATATLTCLPMLGPGGHGNSRTTGRRYATARYSRTVGIC